MIIKRADPSLPTGLPGVGTPAVAAVPATIPATPTTSRSGLPLGLPGSSPVVPASKPTSSGRAVSKPSPATKSQGFDLTYYPEVLAMQKELDALNQAFATSRISDLTSNKQLASLITKTINFSGAAPEKQTDLQTRIHQLSMVTKQNKGLNIFDGKWGPNTNNALISAILLAKGMIALSKMTDAKLPPIDYPKMYPILENKEKLATPERAKELTIILKQMAAGIEPFAQTMKTGAESLSQDAKLSLDSNAEQKTYAEAHYLANNGNARVGTLLFNQQPISYNDLATLDAFKSFMKRVTQTEPTEQSIVQAIKDLKGQLPQSTQQKPVS